LRFRGHRTNLGRAGIEIAQKAQIVGIGAVHLAVLTTSVLTAPMVLASSSTLVAEREHSFLVRNRDIAAGKFATAQPLEKGVEVGGATSMAS
jgi:predicted ATP-grasp superfamily ATP-dependent carboligase